MMARVGVWCWTATGMGAVAILIWVLLPRLGLPVLLDSQHIWLRVVLILFVLVLIVVAGLLFSYRRGQGHRRLLQALSERGSDELLHNNGNDALRRLQHIGDGLLASCAARRLHGHGEYVQGLPFYLVIGDSEGVAGASLRRAVAASGTIHPYSQYPVDGVGISRGLRWWFIGEAVYLEVIWRKESTSGGGVGSVLDEVVKYLDGTAEFTGWQRLFDILTRERGGTGVDGVMLVVDSEKFASDDKQLVQTSGNAANLTAMRLIGDAPRMVLCSRVETIPGGEEFFASLSGFDASEPLCVVHERSLFQGRKFARDWLQTGVDYIARGFRQRVPVALSGLDSPSRIAVLAFPTQFLLTVARVRRYVEEQYGGATQKCGRVAAFFFTGMVVHDGRFQDVDASLSGERLRRDLFTEGLFKRVLGTPERGGVLSRGRGAGNWASHGVAILVTLCVVLMAYWTVGYYRLDNVVNEVSAELDGSRSVVNQQMLLRAGGPETLTAVLGRLDSMQDRLDREIANAPVLGADSLMRLRNALAQAHQRSVQLYLVPFVVSRMEEILASSWSSKGTISHTLDVYRMLAGAGAGATDRSAFMAWAKTKLTPRGSELNSALGSHLFHAKTDWRSEMLEQNRVVGRAVQRLE